MVTNHGIHEWKITAGLPDTGGQNVYVNDLSATLVKLGFRVSIFNRGGYPHPQTGVMREGEHFRSPYERIVYLSDSVDAFVRKEDMGPRIGELGTGLASVLEKEGLPVSAVLSHYWDGAMVAERARRKLPQDVPHVWIPHSLGALKKSGTSESEWKELRLEERISAEKTLLEHVDVVACTSKAMEATLAKDYGRRACAFLPPCVDTGRFDREAVREDTRAVSLLCEATGRSEELIRRAPVITEVSRTDRTKRKDVLIRAFARVHEQYPDTVLAVTIDPSSEELYGELTALIGELSLRDSVAVLGSVWEYVPSLYGLTAVYCTPSIMEGFGMSIQEAAACGVPAVASTRVPFAVEFLAGDSPEMRRTADEESEYRIGDGAVIVAPDSVAATAEALSLLIGDPGLRASMGERAYGITIPRFTWQTATATFLREAGIGVPAEVPEE